jgi:hypothetical protein
MLNLARLTPWVASPALMGPTAPAADDPPLHAPAHGKRAKDAARWDARYPERQYVADNRHYCRRCDGTTGLIIGALASRT